MTSRNRERYGIGIWCLDLSYWNLSTVSGNKGSLFSGQITRRERSL
jgi:hypothetical protein